MIVAIFRTEFEGTALPSRAEFAERFGLSKTQVSSIIREGARLGYLTVDKDGVPAPTAYLRESYEHWISYKLAFYARHMRPRT